MFFCCEADMWLCHQVVNHEYTRLAYRIFQQSMDLILRRRRPTVGFRFISYTRMNPNLFGFHSKFVADGGPWKSQKYKSASSINHEFILPKPNAALLVPHHNTNLIQLNIVAKKLITLRFRKHVLANLFWYKKSFNTVSNFKLFEGKSKILFFLESLSVL